MLEEVQKLHLNTTIDHRHNIVSTIICQSSDLKKTHHELLNPNFAPATRSSLNPPPCTHQQPHTPGKWLYRLDKNPHLITPLA